MTEEAAGITVTGNRHRIEAQPRPRRLLRDPYRRRPRHGRSGQHDRAGRAARGAPGPWHQRLEPATTPSCCATGSPHARDGIYLSFTDRITVAGNVVTQCRYGLHSMYSQDARFEDNEAVGNLLGAALMMSDRLVLHGNRIRQHREGPAAYGVLLKDIGDLSPKTTRFWRTASGSTPRAYRRTRRRRPSSRGNLIAGNEVGLALQSNAALTLTGNRIADNLTDVRPLGRRLSAAMRWSQDGRGNSWGQYRGFDADRDGIGDVPHALDDAMDALVRRNPTDPGVSLHAGAPGDRVRGADVPAVQAATGADRRSPAHGDLVARRTMIAITNVTQALRPPRRAVRRLAHSAPGRDHAAARRQWRRKVHAAPLPARPHQLRRTSAGRRARPAGRRPGGALADRLHAPERRPASRPHRRARR